MQYSVGASQPPGPNLPRLLGLGQSGSGSRCGSRHLDGGRPSGRPEIAAAGLVGEGGRRSVIGFRPIVTPGLLSTTSNQHNLAPHRRPLDQFVRPRRLGHPSRRGPPDLGEFAAALQITLECNKRNGVGVMDGKEVGEGWSIHAFSCPNQSSRPTISSKIRMA